MTKPDDMQALAGRAEQLIHAITDAIMASTLAAAERIEMASGVARIQTRMAAFGAVLEAIAVQKEALAARLTGAAGATRALIERQLDLLAAQELRILARVGVPPEAVEKALAAVDAAPTTPPTPTHRREGRRFIRTAAATSDRNGSSAPGEREEDHNGS